jgi:polyisoprenoid-binding protein YceI
VAAADSIRSEGTTLFIAPGRSSIHVQARSNVGPIEFTSTDLTGDVMVYIDDGRLDVTRPPTASLTVPVASLASGNTMYDVEVQQRLHAQRYPTIRATLHAASPLPEGRFVLDGIVTIHGTSRALTGTVQMTLTDHPRLYVEGEHVIDMRDFDIRLPNALMLRIYPDVLVRFRLEAAA